MIKLFTFVPDVTGVALQTPRAGNIQRLTVSTGMEPVRGAPPGAFNGRIECAHYADMGALLTDHGCSSLTDLRSRPSGMRWIAEQWVAIDGVPKPHPAVVKLTALVQRQPHLTHAQFCAHYRNVHAPLVRKTPFLVRYVQNYLIADDPAGLNQEFDGIAELWWNDRDSAERSWNSREIQEEQAKDMPNFMTYHGAFMFGDEALVDLE